MYANVTCLVYKELIMKQQGESNINVKLSGVTHKALKLLCVHRDQTQAQLIEQLIIEASRIEQEAAK
jgi:hypothetical protein